MKLHTKEKVFKIKNSESITSTFITHNSYLSAYHCDALGTPRKMTDELGVTVTWSGSYYPFGEATISGTRANTHQFTGKEMDSEMGLNSFCQRYYDPQIGRFMSLDNWTNLPDDKRLLSYEKYLSWDNYKLKFRPQSVKQFKKRFYYLKNRVSAYDSLSSELVSIFPQTKYFSASLIDSNQLQNKNLRILGGCLCLHQLNGYSYCENNPLIFVDPNGHGPLLEGIFHLLIPSNIEEELVNELFSMWKEQYDEFTAILQNLENEWLEWCFDQNHGLSNLANSTPVLLRLN